MNISVKEMKNEALKRLKKLNASRHVIRSFNNGVLYSSEFCGMLYPLDEEQKRMVEAFEKKHHALVYHIIRQHTIFGEMLCFLYVSDNQEEWKEDEDEIACGQTCAYVINLTVPDCSELGSIGIEPNIGGIVRTC